MGSREMNDNVLDIVVLKAISCQSQGWNSFLYSIELRPIFIGFAYE
jgi:hypothetical protein